MKPDKQWVVKVMYYKQIYTTFYNDTSLCNIIIYLYNVISGSKTIQERHVPFDRMENEVDGEFAGDDHYFLNRCENYPLNFH